MMHRDSITDHLTRHSKMISELEESLDSFCEQIERIAMVCQNSISQGGKIMFIGNGGSAADSQHLATELVSRYKKDRPPIKAIALTVDSSCLTAISNDYSFSSVFSRQVSAIGSKGDVLIALSTSGNSINVIEAVKTANDLGIITISMTGKDGGELVKSTSLSFRSPSNETPIIQESHIMAGHIICSLLEESLMDEN